MKRFSLTAVGTWSLIALALSLAYGIGGFFSGKLSVPLPAQLVYLFIGLLGALVDNALKAQQRRISELERALSQRT